MIKQHRGNGNTVRTRVVCDRTIDQQRVSVGESWSRVMAICKQRLVSSVYRSFKRPMVKTMLLLLLPLPTAAAAVPR